MGGRQGLCILPKDTLTCRPEESNPKPSDKKTLVLPLSHGRPFSFFVIMKFNVFSIYM